LAARSAISAHTERDLAIAHQAEQAMTQHTDIRRHPDGSIDLDFYRKGATALRRQAMHEAKTMRRAGVGLLAMAGMLCVATVLAATSAVAPNSPVAVAQITASSSR
jgi:hypothetical protein